MIDKEVLAFSKRLAEKIKAEDRTYIKNQKERVVAFKVQSKKCLKCGEKRTSEDVLSRIKCNKCELDK